MKRNTNITIWQLTAFVVFALFFSSCYTHKDKTLLQDSKSLPVYEQVSYENYKIQVNDELILRVISTDEDFIKLLDFGANASQQQNFSYRVYPDGTIDLPFLKPIKVVDLTIQEAITKTQSAFREIVHDAEVKMTLSNKSYTVIGDVGTGVFPIYKERLSIYQALAQSGEILLSGDRKHVKIIRDINGEPEILEFDIRTQSVIDSKYYYIYPNDIIYVQREAASFYKSDKYSTFIGLVTSSISLFTTVFYYTKLNKTK